MLAGLVWAPVAGLVAVSVSGTHVRAAVAVGATCDTLALSVAAVIAPELEGFLLGALGVAVLLGAYLGGRGLRAGAAG